jgi:hypothetical protein
VLRRKRSSNILTLGLINTTLHSYPEHAHAPRPSDTFKHGPVLTGSEVRYFGNRPIGIRDKTGQLQKVLKWALYSSRRCGQVWDRSGNTHSPHSAPLNAFGSLGCPNFLLCPKNFQKSDARSMFGDVSIVLGALR